MSAPEQRFLTNRGTVLLIGLGDLGARIAKRIGATQTADQLVIGVRRPEAARDLATLLDACGGRPVQLDELDASDSSSCEAVLRRWTPDLVVQCASVVSPWRVATLTKEHGRRAAKAGFALQLPFQLVCILQVMRAAKEVGFEGPVINCSYPDATNAMLSALDLAPTTGIGNVGMMQAMVEASLRREGRREKLVRLVGHHSQTVSVVTRQPLANELGPWVFLGEDGRAAHHLAYQGAPIAWGIETNELTAAVALPVIQSLLPDGPPLRTSVPGPLGLFGGFPVRIDGTNVEIDLPASVTMEDAKHRHQEVAMLDGLADLSDGVATWTDDLREALTAISPGLAEPLEVSDCIQRAAALAAAIEA